MNKEEFKIHFIYNKNGNRVELGYPEIQSLLFLNEHGFLSQPQLYQFFSFVQTVHAATFRKKTGKWLEAGLIKKKSVRLQNGHSVVIISLAGAGLTLLKKLGYIKENVRLKSASLSNLDHSLAIKQVALDFIDNHRSRTNAHIYYAKNLYYIGIQPNLFFNTLKQPVIIFKTKHLGEDCINHFKQYDCPVPNYKDTLLTSINPYKEKIQYNDEVIADWLFETGGQYFHLEVDCGNEQIRKSKSAIDTSIEGKLTRLPLQLENKKITHTNYHVVFIVVDNRNDAILTCIQPNRIKRIANMKQQIALFSDFSQWQFETYVIPFSRSNAFLKNLFQKNFNTNEDKNHIIDQIIEGFSHKEELQFKKWISGFMEKEKLIKTGIVLHSKYISDKIPAYAVPETRSLQLIIPFFINEGNVKNAEQLANLASDVEKGLYGGAFTKILVIYPTSDELNFDIIRKHKKNSKDPLAMETSNMIFIAYKDFINNDNAPKLFNESKKQISYSSIFDLSI